MNETCPDCGGPVDSFANAQCDDCAALVCDDYLITCSGDDYTLGCDAGLCDSCHGEHVSEHSADPEMERPS